MGLGDPPAGRSAREKYGRLKEARARRLRSELPWILAAGSVAEAGCVAVAWLGPKPYSLVAVIFAMVVPLKVISYLVTPSHLYAWKVGTEGEVRTAQALEPLRQRGFEILHDRQIPFSRANIDHIVVGATGVFAVETKSYSGKIEVRGDDLFVNGRRKTAETVDEVEREAFAVGCALDAELRSLGLAVRPILCFHRADLPLLFGRSVRGIPIRSGRTVAKEIASGPTRLWPAQVAALTRLLDDRLPPAFGRPPSLQVPPGQSELAQYAPPRPLPPPPATEPRVYWRKGALLRREVPVPPKPQPKTRPPESRERVYWTPEGLKRTTSDRGPDA